MNVSSRTTGRSAKFTLTALALAAVGLSVSVQSAAAFGGGNGSPTSNGSFFPNEGSFQATIRATNLSGVATFSTASSNSTTTGTSSGTFAVTYQGTSYTGNVDAAIDSSAGTIAATLEASVNRGDATSSSPATGTITNVLSTTYGITAMSSNYTSTTGTTTTLDYGLVDTVATTDYVDVLQASGSFTAKLGNSYPNQIFKGKGTMQFTEIDFSLRPPELVTTTVAISVKGSRTSNTATSYTSATVHVPSVITTISTSNR